MRRIAYALAALILLGGTADAADLVLKRVVLSTGGVGYFEYEAAVGAGESTLTMDVPLSQVDDVLKSLVVYDTGGTVGEITLPGRKPLAHSFADLPFGRAALNSEVDLLNTLQGAEITVAAPTAISGRIVHVDRDTVRGPDGRVERQPRVTVMTDKGLQQFLLHDAAAIAFADPKIQRDVETALRRIAAYRNLGRRVLTLHVSGTTPRMVRVGYVVAMPLWKATYRLSLPADEKAATAHLQGWAVLENFSGRAWHNVTLTLLSGNPVTFRQALYESYYVHRPTVPVESGSRVLPAPDTGTVGTAALQSAAKKATGAGRGMLRQLDEAHAANRATAMARPAAAMAPAHIVAASAAEEATQVAFTAPYKVSVAAGQSLVLPLLDRDLPARRVDLYQSSVDPHHPLAAIELTNKSDASLPPGVLTLYQADAKGGAMYLGDARLAAVPTGERRLLSYAVDGKVTVDRSSSERRPIVKATIADGVMHVDRVTRWTTTYRVKEAAGHRPALLIEQRRRSGAKLTAPDPKTVELTAGAYRIPLGAPPSGVGSLDVIEEQPVEETIALVNLNDKRLQALVSSPELDPKVRHALEGAATRRQAVARQRAKLAHLKQQRQQLVQDESRLRSNISVLRSEPAVYKRLLDKFNATDSKLDATSAAIAKTQDALITAEHDLAGYIKGLTL